MFIDVAARGTSIGLSSSARPEHHCREANDHRSRPDRSPSPSLDPAPRSALRLRLETAPRCLESTSTTDVSRHEHPCEHHLWRPPAGSPWGNPAGSRLRDPSRARRFHRSFESDAGPPLVVQRTTSGHPASSGRAIDGAQTGFGSRGNPRAHWRARLRTDAVWLNRGNENRRSFVGWRAISPGKPSDTSFYAWCASQLSPRCFPFAGRGSIRARQCSRFSRSRRCLPPEKSFVRDPCELVQRSAAPAGRRGEPLHVFIGLFESSRASRLRLDPLARSFRWRFVGRMRFYDFCK